MQSLDLVGMATPIMPEGDTRDRSLAHRTTRLVRRSGQQTITLTFDPTSAVMCVCVRTTAESLHSIHESGIWARYSVRFVVAVSSVHSDGEAVLAVDLPGRVIYSNGPKR